MIAASMRDPEERWCCWAGGFNDGVIDCIFSHRRWRMRSVRRDAWSSPSGEGLAGMVAGRTEHEGIE